MSCRSSTWRNDLYLSFYILAHISSTKSLPTSSSSLLIEQRRSAMDAAVNYAHSYENPPPSHLQRTGSSRQYAASLHRPPLNTTIMSNEIERSPNRNLSRRVHSSTSLSSTGYDSNSSPSIKSNRNSIATNNSTDFIAHSLSSSSSTSSSSSDELRRKSKPWVSWLTRLIKVVTTFLLRRIENPIRFILRLVMSLIRFWTMIRHRRSSSVENKFSWTNRAATRVISRLLDTRSSGTRRSPSRPTNRCFQKNRHRISSFKPPLFPPKPTVKPRRLFIDGIRRWARCLRPDFEFCRSRTTKIRSPIRTNSRLCARTVRCRPWRIRFITHFHRRNRLELFNRNPFPAVERPWSIKLFLLPRHRHIRQVLISVSEILFLKQTRWFECQWHDVSFSLSSRRSFDELYGFNSRCINDSPQ